MNKSDKDKILENCNLLSRFFVGHQRGHQLLNEIETIIRGDEITTNENESIETDVPAKKQRGRPRKKNEPKR